MCKTSLVLMTIVMVLPTVAIAGNFDGIYAGVQFGSAIDTAAKSQAAPSIYAGEQKTDSISAVGVAGTVLAGYGLDVYQGIYWGAEIFDTFGNRTYSFKITDPSAPYSEKIKFGNEWGINLRPGYAINDKALVYGLFGWEQIKVKGATSDSGGADFSKTQNAFTLGTGVEISVAGPLTIRIDYVHAFIPNIIASDSYGDYITYKPQEDTFKLGAVYHF